ncbi:MAG: hypothetical protein M9893_08035 [Pyrinomonadaceae bacterium]|nr:hypothetical protein [Pyrinomonadaceae bacterium]
MIRFSRRFEQEVTMMSNSKGLFLIVALMILMLSGSAFAQKRTTKRPVRRAPAKVSTVPPLDVRAAREKVDNQLANVNRFIDVLGPIAQGIEDLDAQAGTKPLSKTAADSNAANKRKVVGAIRNLKIGISQLESEFRTKASLAKYLPQISGMTDLMAQAEDLAIAGKFVASKDPLRGVAGKLTDTLGVMPR